jgi:predicted dehydrogenase
MSKSTRRQFILRSATQAASLGLVLNGKLMTFPPSQLPKPAGPNDRVNLGFIGFGIRGNILLEAAKETQQANLVEVCDCYQGHLERARERTEGKIATNFAQYKKLLDRKDIDAVVVATPDHWHKPIVLDALFDYGSFCVNMAGTFNSASTAGQGIQFLGTEGSLSLLLGAGMIHQPEYKREGYEYSIDSWPKATQEAFLNQDNHRAESQGGTKPEPVNLDFADKPDATVLHLANFIHAVRTRQPSYETAEVGQHAAADGHMVNLSYRSGKRMLWDAYKGSASER